jgi:hypothetical protein
MLTEKPIHENISLCHKLWRKVICTGRGTGKYSINYDLVNILKNPKYMILPDELVCVKAVKFGIRLEDFKNLLVFCPWNSLTIITALDFDYQVLAHWAISNGCPIDFECACFAKFLGDTQTFDLLMSRGCEWSEELYNDPNVRLDATQTTYSKKFIRINTVYAVEYFNANSKLFTRSMNFDTLWI